MVTPDRGKDTNERSERTQQNGSSRPGWADSMIAVHNGLKSSLKLRNPKKTSCNDKLETKK